MAKKRNPPKAPDPNQVSTVEKRHDHRVKSRACIALRPAVQAAPTIKEYGKVYGDLDLIELIQSLTEQTQATKPGDLSRGEEMLAAQTHTLDAIFNNLARRAALNMGKSMQACDTYLKLALRAQSQCRATWEALAAIKNPPIVGYARQANIAQGHQQVNNGSFAESEAPHPRENSNPQNKLLEEKDGERLDFGTTGAAGRADPAMATMGKVDRAENRRG